MLFYIGFGYNGWQKQTHDPKSVTNPEKYSYIQEYLENSAKLSIPQCLGVSACGSGRTDAGIYNLSLVIKILNLFK